MARNSAKQSTPTTKNGRQVAYDREMCIAICRRYLEGEPGNLCQAADAHRTPLPALDSAAPGRR